MKHNNTHRWYRLALFEVWRDMMKTARRMFRHKIHLNSYDGFPVAPMFRDYPGFVLWSMIVKGYKPETMSNYRIERLDPNKEFSPDNCFFTKDPPTCFITEIAETTPKHNQEKREEKHRAKKWDGLSSTRLYEIWKGMKRRCLDPKQKDYPDYGGRGITVCKTWQDDFFSFLNWAWDHGYSPCLSLDRIDVNGNYCPENCRWACDLEQQLNQRKHKQMYRNVRLKVKDMRELLEKIDENVVVTTIIRSSYLPDVVIQETDYPSVPKSDRIDMVRVKK